jgi:hypothetical protein
VRPGEKLSLKKRRKAGKKVAARKAAASVGKGKGKGKGGKGKGSGGPDEAFVDD